MGNDTAEETRSGLDRRTLIKRAAAAGAVAWTAPVILDSLSSPAAAASCPAGVTPDSLPYERTAFGSYTFTAPPGVTQIRIHLWGAGGSSGQRKDANMSSGGGGGGAYASSVLPVSTLCQTFSIVVGMGGAQPPVPGGTDALGNNGENSTVNTNVIVAAGGTAGNGMNGGAGGTTALSVGTAKQAGGSGAAESGPGGSMVGGGGGGAAGATAAFVAVVGNPATNATGGTGGGAAPRKGGDGGTADGTNLGRAGKSGGGGAAGLPEGASTSVAAGADGRVYIEDATP
jgi:hypothetical protein